MVGVQMKKALDSVIMTKFIATWSFDVRRHVYGDGT